MLRGGERAGERSNTSVEIETNKDLGTGILREQIRLAMGQLPTMQGHLSSLLSFFVMWCVISSLM